MAFRGPAPTANATPEGRGRPKKDSETRVPFIDPKEAYAAVLSYNEASPLCTSGAAEVEYRALEFWPKHFKEVCASHGAWVDKVIGRGSTMYTYTFQAALERRPPSRKSFFLHHWQEAKKYACNEVGPVYNSLLNADGNIPSGKPDGMGFLDLVRSKIWAQEQAQELRSGPAAVQIDLDEANDDINRGGETEPSPSPGEPMPAAAVAPGQAPDGDGLYTPNADSFAYTGEAAEPAGKDASGPRCTRDTYFF